MNVDCVITLVNYFSHKSKLDQKQYIYVIDAKGHRFAKNVLRSIRNR